MHLSQKQYGRFGTNLVAAIQNDALVTANARDVLGNPVSLMGCIVPQVMNPDGTVGQAAFYPMALILGPGEGEKYLLPTEADNPQDVPEPVAPSGLILPSAI